MYKVDGTTYKRAQREPTVDSAANGYRLPTEAEWEWAARGGTGSSNFTYSGSNEVNEVAWCLQNSSGAAEDLYFGRGTWPVGAKLGNELGIHDMSGNVWEWCADLYHNGYYGEFENVALAINPQGPKTSFDPDEPLVEKRVLRGGSFLCNDSYCFLA